MIRDELIKAMAKRFRDNKYKFIKPASPSVKREKAGDDDDDDCGRDHLRFNHHMDDGEIAETDVIRTTREDWESRSESKDAEWSVHVAGDVVYAVKLLLYRDSPVAREKKSVPTATKETKRGLPPPGQGIRYRQVTNADRTTSIIVCEMSISKWNYWGAKLPGEWLIVAENRDRVIAIQLED
jgi:hypothetical protein